jgi:hypothetical protein
MLFCAPQFGILFPLVFTVLLGRSLVVPLPICGLGFGMGLPLAPGTSKAFIDFQF